MSTRRSIPAAASLAVLLATATGAQAVPIVYAGVDVGANGSVPAGGRALTAYNAFVAATRAPTTEDFESFTTGLKTTSLTIFGGLGTLTPNPTVGGFIANTPDAGRFNTTPPSCPAGNCKWFESRTTFSVALGPLVPAFGFFYTDLGDQGATLTLDFFNGLQEVSRARGVDASFERGVGFYGLVDDAATFDRVVFNISQTVQDTGLADFVGFDGLVRASLSDTLPPPPPPPPPPQGVPEPTSLALVAASLLLLAASRRRAR